MLTPAPKMAPFLHFLSAGGVKIGQWGMMVMNDASKWHILCPAQSHTAGQSRGRAQQRLPPPLLACAQQIARCGGRLGVYYTFWRASGAGPSISYPAGTHMSPGEQGSGVCAKSGVLKQARRAPRGRIRAREESIATKHECEQARRPGCGFSTG